MTTINVITSDDPEALVTCQLCDPSGQACISKICIKKNVLSCFQDLAGNFPNLPGSDSPPGILAQLRRLERPGDDCGDQLLTELYRSLLRITSEDIRQFTTKQGRLIDTDISNLVTKPEHSVKIVCSAPLNGGGVGFANCVNQWFKQNPDGCLRIYHSRGNWCADTECISPN